jgi:hypothetical protein
VEQRVDAGRKWRRDPDVKLRNPNRIDLADPLTPEQYGYLYDVDAPRTRRVNGAVHLHMRKRDKGLSV